MKRNNKKGFTIVELVIVIAVIGILAAVLIPTFSSVIDQANDSADLQEARNTYTEYLMHHPEADIDYIQNGTTYYDVNDNFEVVDSTSGNVLNVDNWFISGICADGEDADTLCDKCNANTSN